MALVAVLSLVSTMGIIWSVILLRRARDWSMRLLTMVLGLMPLYQTIAACTEAGLWRLEAVGRLKTMVDLVINVLFLLSIFLLEFAIDQRNRAQMQLRVLESNLPVVVEKSQPLRQVG
jgi:hypothetical protein